MSKSSLVTNGKIKSMVSNKNYNEGWDRIFGTKKSLKDKDAHYNGFGAAQQKVGGTTMYRTCYSPDPTTCGCYASTGLEALLKDFK